MTVTCLQPLARSRLSKASEIGCRAERPFMALSFLALSVIPSLKLTDRGLVDVDAWEFVPVLV